jgi:AcrR family transcriptional regulator
MARSVGISRDDVVATAATIADREGLSSATPSAVARALGVRTPSLYHHVDGAAGLRRALARSAADELTHRFATAAGGADDRADALRAIAHAYRDFALEHPGLHDALLPAPAPGEDDELAAAMAAPVRIVAGVMADSPGTPEADGSLTPGAIHAIRAFRAMVYGFSALEAAHGFGIPVDIDESFERAVDTMVAAMLDV